MRSNFTNSVFLTLLLTLGFSCVQHEKSRFIGTAKLEPPSYTASVETTNIAEIEILKTLATVTPKVSAQDVVKKPDEEQKLVTEVSEAESEANVVKKPSVEQRSANRKSDVEQKSVPMEEIFGKDVVVGVFKVQVAAYKTKEKAIKLQEELKSKLNESVYIENTLPYWKVMVGYYNILDKASAVRDRLKKLGYKNAWIVEVK